MALYKANDNYSAKTRTTWTYSPPDPDIDVDAIPANTPTILTVGYGTSYETVFYVTGTSGSDSSNYKLTGVTRIKGYTNDLPAGLDVNCLNHEEYFNQYESEINSINNKLNGTDTNGISPKKIYVDTINEKTLDNGVVIDGIKLKDGNTITTTQTDHIAITPGNNKLVKVAVLRQDITTNSYKNNQVILTGYAEVTGDGVNQYSSEVTITPGITFSDTPIVLLSVHGKYFDASGGFPSGAGGNWGGLLYARSIAQATNKIGTIRVWGDAALTSGKYFIVQWIAIGTL